MSRVLQSTFAGLKQLAIRVSRWVEVFCRYDDRLHERMMASPAATIIATGLAWICLLIGMAIGWLGTDFPGRLWSAVLFGLITAALVFLTRRRVHKQILTHRSKSGLCLQCGYDLRESPDV